jgi:hypothetical protein
MLNVEALPHHHGGFYSCISCLSSGQQGSSMSSDSCNRAISLPRNHDAALAVTEADPLPPPAASAT